MTRACAVSCIEQPIFNRSSPERVSIMLRNRCSISMEVSLMPALPDTDLLTQDDLPSRPNNRDPTVVRQPLTKCRAVHAGIVNVHSLTIDTKNLPICHSRKFLAGIQGPCPPRRERKQETLDPRLRMSRMTAGKMQIPRYARNDNSGAVASDSVNESVDIYGALIATIHAGLRWIWSASRRRRIRCPCPRESRTRCVRP